MLVNQHREGRERHAQREGLSVNGKRNGLYTAEVSLAASAVQWSVAIQQFFPESGSRNANPVVLPDHRREVAHEEQLINGIPAAPQEADDASLKIGAVNPCEPTAVEVELV